ncbi:hypothetical protein ABZX30_28400 [Streptomyces sp. NPDC004542]|uniref:hypothetical protein n=1 Tax=Streptomyces sp. NPDC004542 TaxID=3154281 RepID=UPI0033B76595
MDFVCTGARAGAREPAARVFGGPAAPERPAATGTDACPACGGEVLRESGESIASGE